MPPRWREQYDRVKRWHDRLPKSSAEHQIDDFYAFFTCCFHLKDWLKNDSTIDPTRGPAAEALVNTNEARMICADLANGSKHLALTKHVRVDATAHVHKMEWVFVEPDVMAEDPKRGIDLISHYAGQERRPPTPKSLVGSPTRAGAAARHRRSPRPPGTRRS